MPGNKADGVQMACSCEGLVPEGNLVIVERYEDKADAQQAARLKAARHFPLFTSTAHATLATQHCTANSKQTPHRVIPVTHFNEGQHLLPRGAVPARERVGTNFDEGQYELLRGSVPTKHTHNTNKKGSQHGNNKVLGWRAILSTCT